VSGLQPSGRRRQGVTWSPVVALLVGTAACAPGGLPEKLSTALPGDKKEPPAAVPPGAIGMAAIAATPRNFPRHQPADLTNMFELAAGLGQGAVLIYQWSEPDLVTVARAMVARAGEHGLMPIVGLSPTTLDQQRKELDLPRALRGKRSFADKDLKAAFIKAVEDLARLKPPYLCLATEINLLGLQRLEEYHRFAALYKEAYRAAKKVAPETKVFVSFQYEFVRIVDNKEPGKVQEHAKVIDIFRPELDVVAITSYPSEFYETPADLPANYYSYFRNYLQPGDAVLVMEIGWPSAGSGSEAEQQQFVRRLPELLAELAPKVTAWTLLHDVKHPAFGPSLATGGLLTAAGKPKPALEAWKSLARP
jgi:hypothetical protein